MTRQKHPDNTLFYDLVLDEINKSAVSEQSGHDAGYYLSARMGAEQRAGHRWRVIWGAFKVLFLLGSVGYTALLWLIVAPSANLQWLYALLGSGNLGAFLICPLPLVVVIFIVFPWLAHIGDGPDYR